MNTATSAETLSPAQRIRAAMMGATNPPPVRVPYAKWGGEIYVRQLLAGEVLTQEKDSSDTKDQPAILRALARVLCDENNNRVFDEHDPKDYELLAALPWTQVKEVLQKANEVNGIGKEGKAEAEKNSPASAEASST